MRGFKSFADKIEIEINSGITGIVGPNGSGKSNIADAIRWVLGEQSAKTLRGGKMEDVIFSGTAQRKPLGMAEVSLTFDNTSNQLGIEYSEVTITRRMYRSGESEYFINKTPCRLKNIKEIFMDTGIGIDGYSIIGQGKIEDIFNNRGEDRRLLIEEAAGIVKYRSRKEEAEKKLENTNQNLIRIMDIIQEIESRIEPLRLQSEKTKKFLELKEKLKEMEISSYVFQIDSLESEISSLEQQKNIISEQVKTYTKEKQEIDENYRCTYSKLEEIESSIDMLQKNIFQAQNAIEKKEGELGICNEKILNALENIKRLRGEITNVEKNIQVKTKDLEKNKETLNQRQELKQASQRILQEKLKDLKNVSDRLQEKENDLEKTKGSVIEVLNAIAYKKTELNNLQNLYDHMIKRLEQIHKEDGMLISERLQLIQEKENLEKQYERVQKDIESIEKDKREIQSKIEEWNRIGEHMKEESDAIKEKLQEQLTKKNLLQDMEKHHEGFHKSVKNAIAYAKKDPFLKNRVAGIVAELLDVPKGLETAIEVALGSAVQNIVCKTAQDANQMIQFLKKSRLGRATFLPLDSIQQNFDVERAACELFCNSKGFIGFAVELVKFPQMYQSIFHYLLGKVIIVDKIENGISLFQKGQFKYKIVSLDGDVINPSGAITGGSYRARPSNLLSRRREIEELQESIAHLELQHAHKMKNYLEKQASLEQFKKELHLKEILSNEKEITRIELKNRNEQLEKEIKRYDENRTRLHIEATQLEKNCVDMEMEIKIKEKEIEKLMEDEKKIKNTVEDEKSAYAIERETKEKLEREVTQLRIEATSLEQKHAHLLKNMEVIHKELEELQCAREDKQQELKRLEQKKATLLDHFERLKIELKDTDVLKQQYELNIVQLKEDKETFSKTVFEIQKQMEKNRQTLDELHESCHKIEMRLARLEIQKESLQNKLWDEYQITYLQALDYKNQVLDLSETSKHIRILKTQIVNLGNVNLNAIEEYDALMKRYQFLSEQREDLQDGIRMLKKVIQEMESIMRNKFLDTFEKIQMNFNDVFQELFGGGKATLQLKEGEDILKAGIEMIIQPPGKKLQHLSLLSGGEKALTAISLLFAILKVKPTPFCILDEIDAPLDEANAHRYVRFLKNFSKETQFMIITHKKTTMEAADALYGVTMQKQGISSLISVRLTEKAS